MTQGITTYTEENPHLMIPLRMKISKSAYFYDDVSPHRLKYMFLQILKTDIKQMEVWLWSKETWSVKNHTSTDTCFSLPSCADIRLCDSKLPGSSVLLSENLLQPESLSKYRLKHLKFLQIIHLTMGTNNSFYLSAHVISCSKRKYCYFRSLF